MSSLLVNLESAGILYLTLNRPKVHNAFDDQLLDELITTLTEFQNDEAVKVLVLSSNGKSFCAGADLNWMKSMKDYSLEENIEDSKRLAKFFNLLNRFPAPTIAKVHGAVYGGGVGILGAMDIVIAEKNSKFCFSETKLGLLPAVISPFVLKMGASALRELFLTADLFNTDKALRYGLIHHIADGEDQLTERVDKTISKVLSCGPIAVRKAKELIFKIQEFEHDEEKLTELTCSMIAQRRISNEGQEGMMALLEKRSPNFQGN